jgi:hypothetical protein
MNDAPKLYSPDRRKALRLFSPIHGNAGEGILPKWKERVSFRKGWVRPSQETLINPKGIIR